MHWTAAPSVSRRLIAALLLSSSSTIAWVAEADAGGPTPCVPRASVDATCDGVDDDCSGQIDEDFAGGSAACGVGACVRRGVLSCVAGAVHNACTPLNPAANDASCNGVDDDCDGQLDEEFIATVCVPTLARCLHGTSRCVAGMRSCEPAASCRNDQDRDGVDDPLDLDDDNDGVPDTLEGTGDQDADGLSNALDLDSDGDGSADLFEAGLARFDADGDAVVNGALGDNGLLDALELSRDGGAYAARLIDTDGDGVRDGLDLDSDGDGAFDVDEVDAPGGLDTNHDGVLDDKTDDDLDGLTVNADRDNQYGAPRFDPRATDRDHDGIPRAYDAADEWPTAGDSDRDGLLDDRECPSGWPCADTDAKGPPDYMDRGQHAGVAAGNDLDGDGVADSPDAGRAPTSTDASASTTLDTDLDGVPDSLDHDGDGGLSADDLRDRDRNGIPDRLEPPPTADLSGGALCAAGNGREQTVSPLLLLLSVLAALVLRRVRAPRSGPPEHLPARPSRA